MIPEHNEYENCEGFQKIINLLKEMIKYENVGDRRYTMEDVLDVLQSLIIKAVPKPYDVE